jgi:hypothetical protein
MFSFENGEPCECELKFNPGDNPMQFGGWEFVKLNECGANPFYKCKSSLETETIILSL